MHIAACNEPITGIPNIYICIIVGDLSVENMSEFNLYIRMLSALTGVQLLVTRTPEHAHSLAQFFLGLLIVTKEKGKAIEISYSDVRSLITFFWGFIL
jgi:hypothetical protein